MNMAKLFRTPILKNICERLLKNTSEQLLLTLLLNSKNLLTSYEELSCQFNVKQIKIYELAFYKKKIDSCKDIMERGSIISLIHVK